MGDVQDRSSKARRVRRGNTHERNGKVVTVPAHLWTPMQKIKGFLQKDKIAREVKVPRSALENLQEIEPVRGFTPSREVRSFFDLGEPLDSKPACLETEVGPLTFSSDMVASLNSLPCPLNTKEAKRILVDAADRYARLTAFIAAEQNMTCEELALLLKTSSTGASLYPLPKEVLDAVQRYSSSDDAQLVVDTLDGTREEDFAIIMKAATGYDRYMLRNRDELGFKQHHEEHNIAYAKMIIDGSNSDSSPFGLYSMEQESKKRNGYMGGYESDTTPTEMIRASIGHKTLQSFDNPNARKKGQPFIEEYPSGIVVNLDAEKSVEIVNRYGMSFSHALLEGNEWYRQIRRVVNKNGKRQVVATQTLFGQPKDFKPLFLQAVDFRKVMEL